MSPPVTGASGGFVQGGDDCGEILEPRSIQGEVMGILAMVAVGACAFVEYAPVVAADPYTPVQTQDNAEFAIADGYIVTQMDCTPDLSPVFSSIT